VSRQIFQSKLCSRLKFASGSELTRSCKQTTVWFFFERSRYVCPEPVLVK
jgi:hypothetical protein